MAHYGIDISKHNGRIDFGKVKSAGIEIVLIRAGLGQMVDPRFTVNIEGAKAAGLAVGVYWFSYALTLADAEAEAEFCRKVIGKYGKIPVYYDFEYDTERYAAEHNVTYTKQSRTAIIKTFCNRLRSYGYTAGIYLNRDYLVYRVNRAEFGLYPLWLADWKNSTAMANFDDTPSDSVNIAYGKPTIWQPGKCIVPGVPNMCDIDYYYGELPEISDSSDAGGQIRTDTDGYAVGGKYTIRAGDVYTNGIKVPARLIGKSYTIANVATGRILLREIMSWVKV